MDIVLPLLLDAQGAAALAAAAGLGRGGSDSLGGCGGADGLLGPAADSPLVLDAGAHVSPAGAAGAGTCQAGGGGGGAVGGGAVQVTGFLATTVDEYAEAIIKVR